MIAATHSSCNHNRYSANSYPPSMKLGRATDLFCRYFLPTARAVVLLKTFTPSSLGVIFIQTYGQ